MPLPPRAAHLSYGQSFVTLLDVLIFNWRTRNDEFAPVKTLSHSISSKIIFHTRSASGIFPASGLWDARTIMGGAQGENKRLINSASGKFCFEMDYFRCAVSLSLCACVYGNAAAVIIYLDSMPRYCDCRLHHNPLRSFRMPPPPPRLFSHSSPRGTQSASVREHERSLCKLYLDDGLSSPQPTNHWHCIVRLYKHPAKRRINARSFIFRVICVQCVSSQQCVCLFFMFRVFFFFSSFHSSSFDFCVAGCGARGGFLSLLFVNQKMSCVWSRRRRRRLLAIIVLNYDENKITEKFTVAETRNLFFFRLSLSLSLFLSPLSRRRSSRGWVRGLLEANKRIYKSPPRAFSLPL